MSDPYDTDALVLIPPISMSTDGSESDASESSVHPPTRTVDLLRCKSEALESVSMSESVASARNYFLQAESPKKTTPNRSGSLNCDFLPGENSISQTQSDVSRWARPSPLSSRSGSNAANADRRRKRIPLGCPLRPSELSELKTTQIRSADWPFFSELTTTESDSSIEVRSSQKKYDRSMLFEIDTFLNKIDRLGNQIDARSSEAGPSHRNLNDCDLTDALKNKKVISLEGKSLPTDPNDTLSKYIYLLAEDENKDPNNVGGNSQTKLSDNNVAKLDNNKRDLSIASKKNVLDLRNSSEDESIATLTRLLENRKITKRIDRSPVRSEQNNNGNSPALQESIEETTSLSVTENNLGTKRVARSNFSEEIIPNASNNQNVSRNPPVPNFQNAAKENLNVPSTSKSDENFGKNNEIGHFKSSTEYKNIAYSPFQNKVLQDSTSSFMNISNCTRPKSSILPSLSDLWGGPETRQLDGYVEFQKFEEEHLRRQHCESTIQQLQKRLLEEQQRIAVAVRIDSAKDELIAKMKVSLEKAIERYQSMEDTYKNEIQHLSMQFKSSISNFNNLKQVSQENEAEYLKVVKAATDSEEKYKVALEEIQNIKSQAKKEIEEVQSLMSEKEIRTSELKETNNLVVQLNKQLSENFTTVQNNLETIKVENDAMKVEMTNFKYQNDAMKDEINQCKKEKNDLLSRLNNEKLQNSHLESQKMKMQESLDTAYKKKELLEIEFEKFKNAAEIQKNDLKVSYQKQVDDIILNKVSDLQDKWDSERLLMAKEMQTKEKEIALQFARYLHKVEQHHQYEINILEEKQKEQIKLYKLQLSESNYTIHQLKEKLASYKNKRGEIAAQLHSVMENQWKQALNIITNGGSLESPQNLNIKDEFKKYNHLVLSKSCLSSNANSRFSKEIVSKPFENISSPPINFNENESKKTTESVAELQNNGAEIRMTEEQLQYYIKILLNKVPGVPDIANGNEISKQDECTSKSKSAQSHTDPAKLSQAFDYPTSDKTNDIGEKKSDKYSKMKRPWK